MASSREKGRGKNLWLYLHIENQYIFFSKLLETARLLNQELKKLNPNYLLVLHYANEIKNASTHNLSSVTGLTEDTPLTINKLDDSFHFGKSPGLINAIRNSVSVTFEVFITTLFLGILWSPF